MNDLVYPVPGGMEDWAYSIHVPAGTLASRIKAGTGFDALESERLMLVDLVMRRGLEVFGNKDKFKRWLDRPHKLLGDHTPKQMLNSMDNIAEVLTELGRIEHGVF